MSGSPSVRYLLSSPLTTTIKRRTEFRRGPNGACRDLQENEDFS